jgi:hypothetical protein
VSLRRSIGVSFMTNAGMSSYGIPSTPAQARPFSGLAIKKEISCRRSQLAMFFVPP